MERLRAFTACIWSSLKLWASSCTSIPALLGIVGELSRRDSRGHGDVELTVKRVAISIELHRGGLNRLTADGGVHQFQPSLPKRVQLRAVRLHRCIQRSADRSGQPCEPRQLRRIQPLRVQR